jgi:hypothetical protein
MRQNTAAVAEKPEDADLKPIAFWSDTANGSMAQPSLRKFYSKQQIILHLESRLRNLEGIYQRTTSQYRIESARVMREALKKAIRSLNKIEDWKKYEDAPLDLAGSLAKYCAEHREETADIAEAKPMVRAEPKLPAGYEFLDDEEPVRPAQRQGSGVIPEE